MVISEVSTTEVFISKPVVRSVACYVIVIMLADISTYLYIYLIPITGRQMIVVIIRTGY